MGFQLGGIASANPPKIRKRTMGPEQLPICHLVKFGDPYPILVWMDMLCHNIHGDFSQIEVGTHSSGSSDPGGF